MVKVSSLNTTKLFQPIAERRNGRAWGWREDGRVEEMGEFAPWHSVGPDFNGCDVNEDS